MEWEKRRMAAIGERSIWMYLRIVFISICYMQISNGWNINLEPRQIVNAATVGSSFRGIGASSHNNHFKLVEGDGKWLLVGGRNVVYNLSTDDLALQTAIEWPPTGQDLEICRMKGKSKDDCQNYVRVLAKQRDGRVVICGTNAYKPMCRQYALLEGYGYQVQREFSGFAISPYDPRHNSTAVYLSDTDELYTGTVSDFTGSDPLAYRKPLSGGSSKELRTQRNNVRCLNDPDFVSASSDEEAVYFFFRETALEYANCVAVGGEKASYARVARVCRSDQGGTRADADTWTTFAKARLNCSLPGAMPFYFDELQSTAVVDKSSHGKSIIYAVFTTPYNGLRSSAVCAFRLDDVKNVLSRSAFKVQGSPNSLWAPIGSNDEPLSRPRTCTANSGNLPDDVLKFIQKNSLVDQAVPSAFNEALVVHSDFRSQFTCIAVHPGVVSANGATYDVLFIGTDDGHVMKVISVKPSDGEPVRSTVIEDITVFPDGRPVDNLLLRLPAGERNDGRLIVVSREELKSLPLYYCLNKTACGSCVRLQDPYCAWDVLAHQCIGRTNGDWSDSQFKQAIDDGEEADCYGGESEDKVFFTLNDLSAQSVSSPESSFNVSEINMAVAIIITLTIATAVGFLAGYRVSQWRRKSAAEYSSPSSGATCGDTNGMRCRLTDLGAESGSSTSPTSQLVNDEAADLMPPRRDPREDIFHVAKDENERFLNPLDNRLTCKDYKVRRLYL